MSMKVEPVPEKVWKKIPKMYYKGELLDYKTSSLIYAFHVDQITNLYIWSSGNKHLIRKMMRAFYGLIHDIKSLKSGCVTENAFDLDEAIKLVDDHVFYPQFYGKIFYEYEYINFANVQEVPQRMIDTIMLCCTTIGVVPKAHAKDGKGENEKHKTVSKAKNGLIFVEEDFYNRYRKAGTKIYDKECNLLDDPKDWPMQPTPDMIEYEKKYKIQD